MPLWRRKSFWLALSVSWLLLILLGVFPLRLAVPPRPLPERSQGWPRWLDAAFLQSFSQSETPPEDAPRLPQAPRGSSCTWGSCFDTSKCKGNVLKIFVHSPGGPTTEAHRRILDSLESSRYYAPSPAEACLYLFLPSQDHTCGPLPPYWNGGRNHLVLSLYPAPCTRLGQAMVAEASPSLDIFRPGFDVSLPYLPEAHPLQGGAPGQLQQHSPQPGATLLAVAEKGRWRITDTHSSTCPWDKHCEQDPGLHPTHPGETLPNATFCLIPGHRPAASCFLQALQAGCIPVLLSPRWELPFSEVIDWTKAAIIADERLPLQVLAALRDMLPSKILSLRQQTQFLWTAYFSSVDKVIHTTLEIIQDRIWGASAHSSLMWNSPPGALLVLPTFSTSLKDFPFYHLQQGFSPESSFSALIWVGVSGEPLLKLLQVVAGSRYCAQILILWRSEKPPPDRWPETTVPLTVIEGRRKASDRFFPYSDISSRVILSLDAHSTLSTSEVDFAFVVWQSFPERMVGFRTWSHFWDEARGGWGYRTEMANEFSMVLTTAAFYHRYYHTLFTHSLPKALRTMADDTPTCVDVLMNFLVATVTKLPPIKVPYGRQHQEADPQAAEGLGPAPEPLAQDCFSRVAAGFSHMPLVSSRVRLDPVLFKDPVSVQRKKYRSLEKL
ncbi:exostosin-like 1 [Phodopus roborovskii]|uniref:Exostosin-like 1 n=1 Tax=Phodopus roborovskii TaxID=109678 RepID=A0AAV0AAZ8_PHORO|nr:exostosin-like 1 [Phodopus roborovskii]CAH7437089.1 Extl1 [Phodopus roborovskii]